MDFSDYTGGHLGPLVYHLFGNGVIQLLSEGFSKTYS